ncbi:hypothetical protein [Grimontia sp. NTOU-MAR1]|uniref:hypothetical protein n=1 Tax=Grimontia sp. NTOU-MAR1 TaxID=3111011 RepID=UPI002DBCE9EA|nr:hypothetical protein [Grimontia sp. NTOU-MAR1]WRV97283.1 hypothetical protein VP504_14675 [Grimontia sp. NTOU-MAR1]
MNTQKGMATLAVVSGVLLVVALFTISVANSGLADIKKTQNLVLDAKQRASAKSGLDCAIAVFEQNELNPKDTDFTDSVFNECEGHTGSVITVTGSESPWILSSSSGYASTKIVIQAGGAAAAAFKTSGSLVVEGGNAWIPAKGDKVATTDGVDIYECTAIIAGGDVTIDVGKTTAEFLSELTNANEQCHANFSTYIPSQTDPVTNNFELDILTNQENIDVFQDFFGVPKEKWETVRSGFDVTVTTGTSISNKEKVSSCGTTIKDKIKNGSTKIWIDGDCKLDGIYDPANDSKKATVVIRNGVVGAFDTIKFNGTLVHFTHGYSESSVAESWGASFDETNKHFVCEEGAMHLLCRQLIDDFKNDAEKWGKLPFYFHGSYESLGSYLLDVANSKALIKGSFKPDYDDDTPFGDGGSSVPKLVKGSIHDF